MKAVGYSRSLAISEEDSLVDIELPQPVASGHDLLVKIKAIAVNPVDYKIRQRAAPEEGSYKVIGWDAVGEVLLLERRLQASNREKPFFMQAISLVRDVMLNISWLMNVSSVKSPVACRMPMPRHYR